MAHDTFISYASADKAVADAVCATLESRKIRCWIAPRDVLPGVAYAEALIEAINQSRLMVIVFSKNSNDSQQVMREVERAVHKGIPILPFRIEDVTPSKAMEYFLSSPHWLDALTPPLEQHLQKLADSVEVLLGTGPVSPQETGIASKTNKAGASKSKFKPVYLIGVIVLVAVCVFALYQFTSIFKGRDKTDTLITGGGTSITSSPATEVGSTSTGLPGQTASPMTPSASSTESVPTITGSINSSGQLVSGASISAVLKKGETQWYQFNTEATDAVYAVLSEGSNSASMQPWLELLGPDGNLVTGSYGSVSYALDRGINQVGKYTLRVRDYANVGGSYVLSFMQLSKSVYPLTSGLSLQGQLKIAGDVNWYTFDASGTDAVYAVLSEGIDSTSLQPWLELLSPDGNLVIGSYGSVSYAIDRGISKAGKYTLRVRDYGNKGGNYVLSFMELSQRVNPLTSGTTLMGQLKVPGDVNWYTFEANAGDTVNAVLSEGENSELLQPWLELLGPDGNRITGSYGSVSYAVDRALTKSGIHTLRVRDYANKGGNYLLSFNLMKK